jgi:hypothetical protein
MGAAARTVAGIVTQKISTKAPEADFYFSSSSKVTSSGQGAVA